MTDAHQARDRRRADLGPHAGRDRDGVRDARIARRVGPRDRRARSLGSADRRGLVRPAVGEADRARDYVAIMRKVFRREGPVAHEGRAITLPYAGAGRDRAGQAAAVDPAPESGVADLSRGGRPRERRARGRGRRRLDPDGPLPRQRGRVPRHAGEGRGAIGARARHARDPGVDHRAPHRRRGGHDRGDEAARRAVRRRDGRARPQLPQGRDGARAATPTRPSGSRSCSSRAGATTRPTPSPTNTSTRARCSAPPTGSRNDSSRGPSAASPA